MYTYEKNMVRCLSLRISWSYIEETRYHLYNDTDSLVLDIYIYHTTPNAPTIKHTT